MPYSDSTARPPIVAHRLTHQRTVATSATLVFTAVNNSDSVYKAGIICWQGPEHGTHKNRIRQTGASGRDARHEWGMHYDIDADLYGNRLMKKPGQL